MVALRVFLAAVTSCAALLGGVPPVSGSSLETVASEMAQVAPLQSHTDLGEAIDVNTSIWVRKPQSTQTLGLHASQTTFALDNSSGLITMEAVMSVVTNETQAPTRMCGNGVRQGEEQCDDGNLVDGDGCNKYCKVEGGFACKSKMVDDIGDRCHLCKDDECTAFFFSNSHCMRTTASNISVSASKTAPLHVRRISGFCRCAENHCMDIDGAKCRPEKDGWTAHTDTNLCECGLGHCLMPMADQVISSPSKYHCQKLKDTLIRNEKTGLCECAPGSPKVESADPAKASPEKLASCKVYPSTPVLKIPNQGPVYPEFACMAEPYMKANGSDVCDNCTVDACRMPRIGVSASKRNLGAIQPNQFYCVANATMETIGMTRGGDGSCQCAPDQCLVPYRDTMKCVSLQGSHPYGGVKLSDGKCGCSEDADACIMPTTPGGLGKPSAGFVCLRLKEGAQPTSYGKKYFRGRNGFCRCLASRCRADPTPSSVGTFRCIDIESGGAYKRDPELLAALQSGSSTEEDVPCACANGACMLPGDTGNIPRCVTCPTAPGHCVGRCSADEAGGVINCIKYCSTKHVKTRPAVGAGPDKMFEKRDAAARVIRCFIAKTITCEQQEEGKECTQKITARAIYDCPGVYSKRASRKLIDGTDVFGFKSVCSVNNHQCQKDRCNSVANPAVCLQAMLLS